ncbi:exonuclease GOR-like [Palaemon carinicauda]|uniref:exonuclease GOR-like n=1 Tax=Palaemon carinicauda TaxID=392227 RepID=UPI0035B62210
MAEPDYYSSLLKMTLSEADLERYHFPRPHPFIMDKAVIFDIKNSYFTVPPGPCQRTCKRCFKVYFINSDGLPTVKEECLYHPFKLSRRKFSVYPCCQGSPTSPPCSGAPFHISKDIDPDKLDGFISTRCNTKVTAKNVYAIDCEMVCTKAGMEIASISIVNTKCELVYEAIVLPDNPVLDYLTEYSRLTEIAFVGVTMKLADLHVKLLELFGEQTILVGHGISSDLLYLKLFHNNIIDTMVLYGDENFVPSLAVLKERFIPPSESSQSFSKCREDAETTMKLALLRMQQQP